MSDISVRGLEIALGFGRLRRPILNNINLDVRPGECFGLIGESGSGKSTVLRCIARLLTTWEGDISIDGESVRTLPVERQARIMQMVFQDPYGSLHPRQSVKTVLLEPLRIHRIGDKAERIERAERALIDVGLPAAFLSRYPHELSGGQRQRVAIARALMLEPKILLLDEPTSALDVSVQAEVLNLLSDLKASRGLTYVIVSHDLSVVDHMCDRFGVMRGGDLLEVLDREVLTSGGTMHEYTRELVDASLGFDRPAT
jgi:ABC-type dipeptide/oligopeptide/nickel transport system ATPase subunit